MNDQQPPVPQHSYPRHTRELLAIACSPIHAPVKTAGSEIVQVAHTHLERALTQRLRTHSATQYPSSHSAHLHLQVAHACQWGLGQTLMHGGKSFDAALRYFSPRHASFSTTLTPLQPLAGTASALLAELRRLPTRRLLFAGHHVHGGSALGLGPWATAERSLGFTGPGGGWP